MTWRRQPLDESGFTLIETLVVLAILGVIVSGLAILLSSALQSETDQTNRSGAQRDARLALDQLRREIHCASGVATSSATSVTINIPWYCATAPNTTLSSAVTLPNATISVASTGQFNSGANTIVFGTSGLVACTGITATSFTGCTGGASGTYSSGTAVRGSVTLTWCTTGASAPFQLKRFIGSACSGTGKTWATSLTSSSVFTYSRSGTLMSAPMLTPAATGGNLVTGTYAYDVTAVLASGAEVSGGIARATITTGNTNQVTVAWSAYAGATGYRVYGRDDGSTTTQGLRLLASTGSSTFSYVDTGAVVTSTATAAPPLATLTVSLLTGKGKGTAQRRFVTSDSVVLRNSGRF